MIDIFNRGSSKDVVRVSAVATILLTVLIAIIPYSAYPYFPEYDPNGIIVLEVDAGWDDYLEQYTAYSIKQESIWYGSTKPMTGLWALEVAHMSHDGRLMACFDTEHDIFNMYSWATSNQSTASTASMDLVKGNEMSREHRIRFPCPVVFYSMSQSRSLVVFFLQHSDAYAPEFPLRRVKRNTSLSVNVPNIEHLKRHFKDPANGETIFMLRSTEEDSILVQPDMATHPYSFDTATGPYMFWWSINDQEQCQRFSQAIVQALEAPHYWRFAWRCGSDSSGAGLSMPVMADTSMYLIEMPERMGEGLAKRVELEQADFMERIDSSTQLEVLAFCLIDGTVELLIFEGVDE